MNHSHPHPILPAQAHFRALPSTLPSVFDYDDYRDFLRDWVASRRAQWPAYSLQLLANRSKIKSRSFLRLVCLGKRHLGPGVAVEVARAMGLEPLARERFLDLVQGQRDIVTKMGREDPLRATGPRRMAAKSESHGISARGDRSQPPAAPEDVRIKLACHLPEGISPKDLAEIGERLRAFRMETESWLARRTVTVPPAPVGDPIAV